MDKKKKKKSLLRSVMDAIVKPAEAPTVKDNFKKVRTKIRKQNLRSVKPARKKVRKDQSDTNLKDISKALAKGSGTYSENKLGEKRFKKKVIFRDKNWDQRRGTQSGGLTPKKAIYRGRRRKGKK